VRTVFFALLFANLAFFAWSRWVDVPRTPAANEQISRLPRLKLVDELPPSAHPTASNDTNSAPPGKCLSVGPFADVDNSARAAALLQDKGFDPRQRAEAGEMSAGYWVYLGGMKRETDTDKMLVSLERNGIKDALVMPESADSGRRVSLGLFSERTRAEKRAQSVRQMGFKAEGHIAFGEPIEEICALAQSVKADLIVVGHQRRASLAARWWRSSVGASLIEYAPCSVLIAMAAK